MVLAAASDWAQIGVTVFLGVLTLVVGLSINVKRRQEMAATVAQNRFGAYAALWAMMPYSPELRALKGDPPLTRAELSALFDQMTGWYYEGGHGMLLGRQTRGIYLTVKANLVCSEKSFRPAQGQGALTEAERSRLCIRQLSLLRSSMRGDLEVYGKPWGSGITAEDRLFLKASGVSWWRIEHSLRERLFLLSGRSHPRVEPETVEGLGRGHDLTSGAASGKVSTR